MLITNISIFLLNKVHFNILFKFKFFYFLIYETNNNSNIGEKIYKILNIKNNKMK